MQEKGSRGRERGGGDLMRGERESRTEGGSGEEKNEKGSGERIQEGPAEL